MVLIVFFSSVSGLGIACTLSGVFTLLFLLLIIFLLLISSLPVFITPLHSRGLKVSVLQELVSSVCV